MTKKLEHNIMQRMQSRKKLTILKKNHTHTQNNTNIYKQKRNTEIQNLRPNQKTTKNLISSLTKNQNYPQKCFYTRVKCNKIFSLHAEKPLIILFIKRCFVLYPGKQVLSNSCICQEDIF